MGQLGMVTNPARGQLNMKKIYFPLPPFAPGNLASRPVSAYSYSTLRLNLMRTHGVSLAFRDGVHVYRQPPSGQS